MSARARWMVIAAILFTQTWRAQADPVPFGVTVSGSGRPMILIPGLACGGNVWDGTVEHFKGRYQCHVLTLAGFAGQPALDGPFLAKVRDGIVKYIGDQKLDHPVIIGHSLGGMMSFWVAETAPGKVGPIISVDGLPFYPAALDSTLTAESARPQAERFRAMYAGASQEQFTQSNQRFLAAMITSPEDVEKVAALGAKSNPKAVGQAAFELFTTDLRPGLKSIQAPVLLIGAGAAATDETTKAQIEKAYADQIGAIPRHKLAFAPRARHFVQLDAPQFFYAEVDDFLKDNQK